MKELRGQSVSQGIAIGPAVILTTTDIRVKESHVDDDKIEREVRRFRRALGRARTEIRELRDQSDADVPEVGRIVDTHLGFLRDPNIVESVEEKIRRDKCVAAYAVSVVLRETADRLSRIDNPVISERARDINDIERRLLNQLLGGSVGQVKQLDRTSVVVADDITPTQTASMDRDHLAGFATECGNWYSHTAILARALQIPAVVGLPSVTREVTFRSTVIVDGDEGKIIVDPDPATLADYRKRKRRKTTTSSAQVRKLKSETREGERCELLGNVETTADIPRVVACGGTGVGLFRTEFLFLGREDPPDEEAQYLHYKEAVEKMGGGEVTFRSMDFGGDKFDRKMNDFGEPNPFMGERAIRVSFRRPSVFRSQLRAILRASVHGPARLMFPMIIDVGEFRRAKEHVEEARRELDERGVAYDPDLPIGTMIEVPSAAMNAARLARDVDFFSIGTNDLTQYALGVDRTNHRVADLYASHHPSIARMIRMVVEAAQAARKSVGVCGEMAGDPRHVPLLLGLGIRRFSASPPQIPIVKRKIRSLFLSRCLQLADQAVAADDAAEVAELLEAFGS